ncbi:glycoside hydrolase family 3 N-terminal domain-containing protein [Paenarthrobacter aurescens]|uniref:glycoside hydrolase family 3 N-terminal domain-containing protein n=1 Tax=Paenarthrobacter aurescens TaxID=43663 RepID=UPI0021C0E9E7|nr:glycoside hydrolase family 3 N-terminal domain-containing protein [Paenarthrobacter aurescens]MCT9870092.1 glycoside hydrolase family 3 protein [Paenarthrobacter aurescens]
MRKTQTIASLGMSIAAAGALVAMASGCSTGNGTSGPTSAEGPPSASSSPPGSPAPTTSAAAPTTQPASPSTPSAAPAPASSAPSVAEQQLAALSLEQRVGQLFMVASKATGAEPGTMEALKTYHAGNVYLSGRSKAGAAATAAVVSSLTATVSPATTGGVPLFVATDQEGGYVQVLSGPGFSAIPTALVQAGAGPAKLRTDAATWGRELRSAGVNVNLAPVLDTVTSPEFAPSNAPIGHFQREYGYAPGTVSTLGNAFADGMKDAGVAPVVKHFPGLGRVVPNTDVTSDVRDAATTRTDAALEPFHDAIKSGTQWVMVSNAYYDKIDPANIAPFSPTVMDSMLRADAGFTGIVLSDDLCSAAQLEAWSDADRALKFFGAGGTMLVCADPASLPAMHQAVMKKAQTDPAFRAKVDAAALTVLRVKAGQ